MDFAELAVARRTVHNFKPDPIADELVEQALGLSLWAQNHRLTFPWVYTRIGPAARARLADLAVDLKKAAEPDAPLSEVKIQAVRANVLRPSHLISLGLKRAAKPEIAHEDFATLGGSVQIAAMFLWSHGIASKWSTGGFTKHLRTYEILGLSPQEVALEGCLMIGHAQDIPAAKPRPDLARVLRRID